MRTSDGEGMKVINIIVPGIAVSKLRARKGKNGNFYTPKKLSDYQEAVGWTAKEQMLRQEVTAFEKDVPLWLTVAFIKGGEAHGQAGHVKFSQGYRGRTQWRVLSR